jgi:predicted GNAT family acetyltransferase
MPSSEEDDFSDVSSVAEPIGLLCNRSKWIGRDAIRERNKRREQQKEEQRKAAEVAKAEAEAKAEEVWLAWQAREEEESEGSGLEDSDDDSGDSVESGLKADVSTAVQDEECTEITGSQGVAAEDLSERYEQPKLATVDMVVGIFQEYDSARDGTIDHTELVSVLHGIGMGRALAERVVESMQQNGRVKYADFVAKMFTAHAALTTVS